MEFFTIENDFLKVKVNRVGAEITSIINKSNHKEFIWQGESTVWANHAPVLFPIVGGLKNNEYQYDDVTYKLPRHGFARYNDSFKLVDHSATEIEFELINSDKTIEVYPFEFSFRIKFTLKKTLLSVHHTVQNNSKYPMIFSLGGHPAFSFESSIEDYSLQFSEKEKGSLIVLDDLGLRTDELKSIDLTGELVLNKNSFDNDAWIIENMASQEVSLKGKSGDTVVMSRGDFEHFGIWSKPNAPFVCLEPWLGLADHKDHDGSLESKSHTQTIDPKEIFNASFSFNIKSYKE